MPGNRPACLRASCTELPSIDAVRAGEIDELEHAHLGVRAAAVILDAPQLTGLGVGNDDLAGLHVPQQGRARSIQRATLAGKDVAAAGQGADAQGAVAPGVRTAMSLVADMITRLYAPSSTSIVLLMAVSMLPIRRRLRVMR